ncbi:hypothetical protein ACJMK2_014115 [Sinanodonta woodiana]|uniref:Ankyrin repeat and IBR domain-containing protein 1 n=1 Tax=Sinanodonta woodiana TaxID=1069815 RepID=A0ABD3UZM5_SINWO
MGSSSSKFRKYLQNGDEVAAMNLYNNQSDLRKALDPNCSYGDSHQHETPLHYAARHGMKSLIRIFLHEHGGNPNKTNAHKETSVHCVCMEKNYQYYPVQRRRYECLSLFLHWRGTILKDGDEEKVDIAAADEKENTALHYAASSGLKACVELLVQWGAPLFKENNDNQTPCDCAESAGHSEIALFLESKMVFSNDPSSEDIEEIPVSLATEEEYSGLRAQDLQEAKDQLLVETADMLSVPLFTAEALLRHYEWSREMLLESWMADPRVCCEKSGVTPPAHLFSDKPVVAESLSSPRTSEPPSPDAYCDICTSSFLMTEEPVNMSCDHQFCKACWESYLNMKIQDGDAHNITCPGYGCTKLVPVEVIENIVSRDMARRYLQFDIKAFVESNPSIKWCPYPGCGRAVKFPDMETGSLMSPRHSRLPNDTSRAVDCGNGHYFCWVCSGEAHEPCSCENLAKWYSKISEIRPDTLSGTEEQTENAANCLWLVTNSKPCPNCKSPIQKNEGCNHMKCSKCKYDFCWVCLDQWKRHNSSTGGYFKCNRYDVVQQVEDKSTTVVKEAEERNKKMQELNKFVHYYTRFKNHENSYKFEEPLLKTAKEKMMKLAEAVTDFSTAKAETAFVEDAVHQLLRARRVLKFSYVYGYYLDGAGYRKIVFEFMQTELEECTELLSQMVNRLYLRTPRKKIIEQSQITQRKRQEFISAISKGLVPPETPPALRKHRRHKYSMETDDEDLKKAILASMQDIDPTNPWIVDASGRHANIEAMLNWPSDESDDSDSEVTRKAILTRGQCAREGCRRPRANNPRTGELHEYCSIACSRLRNDSEKDAVQEIPEVFLDEHMDLLRALELSRLQYLRDKGVLAENSAANIRQNLTSFGEHLNRNHSDVGASGDQGTIREQHSRSYGYHGVKDETVDLAERLDLVLQKMLELSSISLPDDTEGPGTADTEKVSNDKQLGAAQFTRTVDNKSTVVSRVPNKSVEDLYHSDCVNCPPNGPGLPPLSPQHLKSDCQCATDFTFEGDNYDSLGACGGIPQHLPDPDGQAEEGNDYEDIPIEGNMLQKLLSTDKIDIAYPELLSEGGSGFGAIKDISVSNIYQQDEDKTKDFSAKDLSEFCKTDRPKTYSYKKSVRLFAANTPGEDEKVFSIVSPGSEDFSESGIIEAWVCVPPSGSQYSDHTPGTDTTADSYSYEEQAEEGESSDDSKVTGVTTKDGKSQGKDQTLTIQEMTENLIQVTKAMKEELNLQDKLLMGDNSQESHYQSNTEVPTRSDLPLSGKNGFCEKELDRTESSNYHRKIEPVSHLPENMNNSQIDLENSMAEELVNSQKTQAEETVDLQDMDSFFEQMQIATDDQSTYV